MHTDFVREGEDLGALSKRLGIPGCMLMRANRIYSPAWLLPGREINVPEIGFCVLDKEACPVKAFATRAKKMSPEGKASNL